MPETTEAPKCESCGKEMKAKGGKQHTTYKCKNEACPKGHHKTKFGPPDPPTPQKGEPHG